MKVRRRRRRSSVLSVSLSSVLFCSALFSSAFISVSVFIFVHCFVVCLFGSFWCLWIDNAVL